MAKVCSNSGSHELNVDSTFHRAYSEPVAALPDILGCNKACGLVTVYRHKVRTLSMSAND